MTRVTEAELRAAFSRWPTDTQWRRTLLALDDGPPMSLDEHIDALRQAQETR